jgi:hypothetical protein
LDIYRQSTNDNQAEMSFHSEESWELASCSPYVEAGTIYFTVDPSTHNLPFFPFPPKPFCVLVKFWALQLVHNCPRTLGSPSSSELPEHLVIPGELLTYHFFVRAGRLSQAADSGSGIPHCIPKWFSRLGGVRVVPGVSYYFFLQKKILQLTISAWRTPYSSNTSKPQSHCIVTLHTPSVPRSDLGATF